MGIKFKTTSQALFVVTDGEGDQNDPPFPRSPIRPHEPDDADLFDQDDRIAYRIREWRHVDARTVHEQSDLDDMHCITIVFRSGFRVTVSYAGLSKIGTRPVDRAFEEAEDLIESGDPRIGPYGDLPIAIIEYPIRVMGLPPRVALKHLKAYLGRLAPAAAKTVVSSPAAR
ncbi:hypothetical protein GGQ91_004863 [Methylobacterium fujisawaense]|uniref:Uncharacterized protein n=1 Tax=Methylobacterium fujisawaense TaxID=107400 RepID=A0ABR6DH65_9HYPH|nr:hypothetical protein [Methylobacterium fujisawaense]MBA9065446.1 hypothetical protein [Methylobacterium fujisawaense]